MISLKRFPLVFLSIASVLLVVAQGGVLTYLSSNAALLNPERGFYKFTETQSNPYTQLTVDALNSYRAEGYTIIRRVFYLNDYVTTPQLPATLLEQITADFQALQQAGFSAVIRFAYSANPAAANQEPEKSILLNHITQLGNVIKIYGDVILVIESGFIGAYGEWYYSTNFGTPPLTATDYTNREDVVNKLLDKVPSIGGAILGPHYLYTALRTPDYKRKLYGTTALAPNEAYRNTYRSRTGHFNDCFLSSADDVGTYIDFPEEFAYLEQETQYVPMGGETCILHDRSDCPNALYELEHLHYTYMNPSYHPDVITKWQTQGCFEEIQNRLGYRFRLVESTTTITGRPTSRTIYNLEIKIQNDGFAATVYRKAVYLVFKSPVKTHSILMGDIDTRQWAPGTETTINVSADLKNLPVGFYNVFLQVTSVFPNRAANPSNSIAFANQRLFDPVTGLNQLNQPVEVVNKKLITLPTLL